MHERHIQLFTFFILRNSNSAQSHFRCLSPHGAFLLRPSIFTDIPIDHGSNPLFFLYFFPTSHLKNPLLKPLLTEPSFVKMSEIETLLSVYESHCKLLSVKPNSCLVRMLLGETGKDLGTIDVSRNYLGERGFQAFLEVVRNAVDVNTLRLVGNGLTNDAVTSLARVLGSHPGIKTIDVRNNQLTLPSALALLSMLRKNVNITSVCVDDTFIDERAKMKILRALERNVKLQNRAGKEGRHEESPFERVRREYDERKTKKRKDTEGDPLATIDMHLRRKSPLIPKRDSSGWAVLNIWISATETDFLSELKLIHHHIIPEMNEALKSRKVYLLPYAAHHEQYPTTFLSEAPEAAPTLETKNTQINTGSKTLLSERLTLIDLCAPVFVMLAGDKHGPVPRYVAPYYANSDTNNVNFEPMAMIENGYGGVSAVHAETATPTAAKALRSQKESQAALYFLRENWRCLKVPEGLVEAVSDDCTYLIADPEGKMRPGMSEAMPSSIYTKRKTLWEAWAAHKQRILDFPPELSLRKYASRYSKVSSTGELLLKELDHFGAEMKSRLWEVVDYLFPEKKASKAKLSLSTSALNLQGVPDHSEAAAQCIPFNELFLKQKEFYEIIVDSSTYIGRNNAVSKIELYLITPTSRNILLVHGTRECGLHSVISLFLRKSIPKTTYILAPFIAGRAAISNESFTLRTCLLALCSQMIKAKDAYHRGKGDTHHGGDDERHIPLSATSSEFTGLPKAIVHEVKIHVIKEYFKGLLNDISNVLPDGKVFVILVDGLERIVHPAAPLPSLVTTETGKSILECTLNDSVTVSGAASSSNITVGQPQPPSSDRPGYVRGAAGAAGTEKKGDIVDSLDWIPKCLPKNVRLVVSTSSEDVINIRRLLNRGQDCCEAVVVMSPGVQECANIIKARLAERRIVLDEDMYNNIILKKKGITDDRYARLLIHRIVQRKERSPDSTFTTFLDSIPDTFETLLEEMLVYAEQTSTPELVAKCLSALCLLPDGMVLLQVREFLADKRAGINLLSGHDVENLMHGIRPFIYPFVLGFNEFVLQNEDRKEEREVPPVAEQNQGKPSNGLAHRLQLRAFLKGVVTERYLPTEAAVVEKAASLTRFLYAASEQDDHPTTVLSLVSYPALMIRAEMWPFAMRNFFNVSAARRFFTHFAGYVLFTAMTSAYARLYDKVEALKKNPDLQCPHSIVEMQSWLFKIKEYTHFIVINHTSLNTKPTLTIQQGLLAASTSNVYREAKAYFEGHPSETYYQCVNKGSLRMGRGRVTSLGFSPNGLRVLAASEKSFALSTVTGSILQHVTAPFTVLFGLVSPTSRYAALVLVDKSVMVYDAVTGTCVTKLSGHTGRIRCCAITARSGYVLTGGDDATLRIWDTESGRSVTTLNHGPYLSITSSFAAVTATAAHPSDERVFVSAIDRTILLWRRETLEYSLVSKTLSHSLFPVRQILWLETGDYFIVVCKRPLTGDAAAGACHEACIRVYDGRSGDVVLRLGGAVMSGVSNAALSPGNEMLAATLEDGCVLFWDLAGALASGVDEQMPVQSIKAFVHTASLVCFYSHLAHIEGKAEEDEEEKEEKVYSEKNLSATPILLCAVSGDSNMVKTFRVDTFALTLEHVCQAKIIDISATSTPTAEGAHLAVGDASGRVYLLRESNLH